MSFERVSRVPRPRVRNRNARGSSGSYSLASRPEIHRGPQHQQIDVAKAIALVLGQARRQRVHLLKLQGIRVQLVEEDRVVEHAGDLRRRRISAHGRTIRFFARPGVPRGNGDDPPRAKVDRRRERRGEPDATVTVPRPVDFDRRKEERQRCRRHHMVDAELARDALSVRPLPRLDPAVPARVHPGQRLPCRVARRRQRQGLQPTVGQAASDALDGATSASSIRPSSRRRGSVSTRLRDEEEIVRPPETSRPPQRTIRLAKSRTSTRNTSSICRLDQTSASSSTRSANGSCRAARYAALMPPAETPVRIPGRMSGHSRASTRRKPT